MTTKKTFVVILASVAVVVVAAIAAPLSFLPYSREVISDDQIPTSVRDAEATEKEAWEESVLPYDPNEEEPTEPTAEETNQAEDETAIQKEVDRIDAKERATVALVMADDRVRDQIKNALQVDSDFLPSEYRHGTDMDKVTLTVTGKEILEGSWEKSYTSKLTNIFTLEIEVKDGVIVSIEKKPLADLGGNFAYSDTEQEMIRAALQDPAVQAAVKEKQDSGKSLAITIRSEKLDFPSFNCPMNQCALVLVREVNSHATLEVWLNTAEGKVVKTVSSDGW